MSRLHSDFFLYFCANLGFWVSICMENGDGKSGSSNDKECVKVAVNVRPLITSELLNGCTDCITVVPGEPQVRNRACEIDRIVCEIDRIVQALLFFS